MAWCCAEFEEHYGKTCDDGMRIDFYHWSFGLKVFQLTRPNQRPIRIRSCPWCDLTYPCFQETATDQIIRLDS